MIVLAIACFSALQGDSDDKEMVDPFNRKRFTVCILPPLENIKFLERAKVVDVVCLNADSQAYQGISKVYKKKTEEYPNEFSHIKFPFGMIHYLRLQMLNYREYMIASDTVSFA